MSIGIYSFLRIYFLSFGLSAFAQFRTRSTPSSVSAGTIYHARPVWYRVQTGVACPASWRVCLALRGLPWLPALVLARPALLPVMCSPSGCAGAGVSTGGVYRKRRGWGGSIFSVEKIQKRRFSVSLSPTPTPPSQIRTHPIVQVSKNSKKYKKAPLWA